MVHGAQDLGGADRRARPPDTEPRAVRGAARGGKVRGLPCRPGGEAGKRQGSRVVAGDARGGVWWDGRGSLRAVGHCSRRGRRGRGHRSTGK
eukprot:6195856-Prymnesium_polylepis.1